MSANEIVNMNDIVEACMKAMKSKMQNLNMLNIVVVGKSGVGKSTLINAIFREELAETGIGAPVTDHMRKYTKKDVPLGIYDTKGFELGKEAQQEVKKELLEEIKRGAETRNISEAIHCIWYCVNVASNRFEPEEEQWIRDFTEKNQQYQIPVIIVLTQAYSEKNAQKLKEQIDQKNLKVSQIVPVLAQDFELDQDTVKHAYGTDKLIEVMQETLPEELVDTLMNVQQVNLQLKKKKAQAYVAAAATSALAAGASPIPFSDAAILVPIQVTMMASITVTFGFDFNKSMIASLVSTVLGTSGTTIGGRAIAANLLKLIPGVGTVAGGVISGGTAAVMTTALGEAYIGVMTAICNGELNADDLGTSAGERKLKKLFKKGLKKGSR